MKKKKNKKKNKKNKRRKKKNKKNKKKKKGFFYSHEVASTITMATARNITIIFILEVMLKCQRETQ